MNTYITTINLEFKDTLENYIIKLNKGITAKNDIETNNLHLLIEKELKEENLRNKIVSLTSNPLISNWKPNHNYKLLISFVIYNESEFNDKGEIIENKYIKKMYLMDISVQNNELKNLIDNL